MILCGFPPAYRASQCTGPISAFTIGLMLTPLTIGANMNTDQLG